MEMYVYYQASVPFCESQQSSSPLLTSSIFIRLFVHSFVSMVTSPFISIEWCFRPYKPYIFWKLIIWWWQWPRQILTKRQIQRQRHRYTDKCKVLPRPNVCYIYQKQGVQGFIILYWLSFCDEKDIRLFVRLHCDISNYLHRTMF